jgi:NAD(P)-dependent dehydrogenase (short-subunit alcohol dehydrogenase family)
MPWPPASVPAAARSVNIASIAGISAAPGIGFYGVSKAAHSLTTQLAFELAPGIRSMRWLPAVIKTRFCRGAHEGRRLKSRRSTLARPVL